jgi:hypothetical protein
MRARSAYAVGRAGVHRGESLPSRPLVHNHSEIVMIEKAKKFAQRGVVVGDPTSLHRTHCARTCPAFAYPAMC